MNGLTNLLQSRKAVIVLLATILLFVLVLTGKVDPNQFLDFIKVTLPTYLAAQGFEDGMDKYNPVKPALPTAENTNP